MKMRHLISLVVSLLVLLVRCCDGQRVDDNKINLDEESSCNAKDNGVALIDVAEDLVLKAKALCSQPDGLSECARATKLAKYMDMTINILTEIKESYPSCKTVEPGSNPRDCYEVLANGERKNGVYTIYPNSALTEKKSRPVYCDMETDGGGWTVIQRRGNFTPQQDFFQTWDEFKVGFGDIQRDFWLGNDVIYALSKRTPVELRIDLEDVRGNRRYAVYKNFSLENEERNYTLRISGYSGNAGDGMTVHSGKVFSTRDRNNVGAVMALRGAWWMNDWAYSHLNGLYAPGQDDPKAIHWYDWLKNEGLAFTEMKLRPN